MKLNNNQWATWPLDKMNVHQLKHLLQGFRHTWCCTLAWDLGSGEYCDCKDKPPLYSEAQIREELSKHPHQKRKPRRKRDADRVSNR